MRPAHSFVRITVNAVLRPHRPDACRPVVDASPERHICVIPLAYTQDPFLVDCKTATGPQSNQWLRGGGGIRQKPFVLVCRWSLSPRQALLSTAKPTEATVTGIQIQATSACIPNTTPGFGVPAGVEHVVTTVALGVSNRFEIYGSGASFGEP